MDRLLSAMTRYIRHSHRTSHKTRTGLRYERRTRLNLELLEDRLAPAIVTVTTLSDAPYHIGTSLRDAIAAANPGDTIQFQGGLNAPLT
jgi:hypothetical protein